MKNGSGLLHFSVSHFSVWLALVAETTIETSLLDPRSSILDPRSSILDPAAFFTGTNFLTGFPARG
jgi:hypothetical protein